MNKLFLLISLSFWCNWSYSQTIDSVLLIKPYIEINDNLINFYNFPAASVDGKQILIVHYEYSCCIQTETNLLIIENKNFDVYTKIKLENNENQQFIDSKEKLKIFKKTSKILKKRNYFSLILIENFEFKKDINDSLGNILFEFNSQKFVTSNFEIPKFQQKGFCCTGFFDDTTKCIINQQICQIWFNHSEKYVLIEYGINNCADGCEVGPWYFIEPCKLYAE